MRSPARKAAPSQARPGSPKGAAIVRPGRPIARRCIVEYTAKRQYQRGTQGRMSEARQSNWIEKCALASFFVASAWAILALWQSELAGWPLVLGVVCGYLLADLGSGFVHWTFDTWWSPTTPVVGKAFVEPFRIHHVDPVDIT